MSKNRKSTIDVQGAAITVLSHNEEDLICLTDIARVKNADRSDDPVRNWLRNRNTVEFLGVWERLNNPDFNSVEFDGIKMLAGLNSFALTPKQWIEETNAIGIVSHAGRYGGTYAHRDIAFEFASWISVEFKLYLIKEFQRLKEDENRRLSLAWNLNRTLSKLNYRIHTDAIKTHLIPRSYVRAGRHHLRQRGGHTQCRPLRPDSQTMAGCQPRYGRQHARVRHHRTTAGVGQYRGNECRTHSHGTDARGTPQASQRDSHTPDAGTDFCADNQTTQGISR
jgi:hypothetical protein